MPTVNTARGPVETSELGRTFMHEHISLGGTDVFANWPELNDAPACLEAATTRFAQTRCAAATSALVMGSKMRSEIA